MAKRKKAPGRPGKMPSWTTGAKTGIGKALNAGSHISFSISSGVITESYYPREDTACLGENFFVVSDGDGFVSDERGDATHESRPLHPDVPAFALKNSCKTGQYVISKEIIADPLRNCILQLIRFRPSSRKPLLLHNITIPRFPKDAVIQKTYVDRFNGHEMLFAETEGMVMAVSASVPFARRSVGFIGKSDGLTQIHKHGAIEKEYDEAEQGHLAMAVTLELHDATECLLVLGFGHSCQEAGHNARASILTGFSQSKSDYSDAWIQWHHQLWGRDNTDYPFSCLSASATVLRVSESKLFPGGMLASLSIPWGAARTDDGLGAYHLVWPRDLILSSGGFAALNDNASLLRVLNYLMTTQLDTGSWPQNMWLDGSSHWSGIQLDQVALPALLLNHCRVNKLINDEQLKRYWKGICRSLDFLQEKGPYSEQDRWEEQSGTNPFTLATQVCGFASGASLAGYLGDVELQQRYQQAADEINARVEELTYVTDTPLSKEYGVDGYYIRINPGLKPVDKVRNEKLEIRKPGTSEKLRVYECVSVDALALVRFGLRSAKDPRILNTIKIIDALLKVELKNGTSWHRYVGDVYGEDPDGNPYTEGSTDGRGRAWPLLTGERAHYEIAAGNFGYAQELLNSMNNFSMNGLLPEQVWDSTDIPDRELYQGQATGSARPLTWAHAEYIKLCRSLAEKKVFDLPDLVYDRYVNGGS